MTRRIRGRKRFHRFGMAVIAAACLSLWVLPGAAAAAWLPPIDLLTNGVPSKPQVGVDNQGAATVVWMNQFNQIKAQRIFPNGLRGNSLNVSEPAGAASNSIPRVAVDIWGTATVVWQDSADVIRGRRISANGSGYLGPMLTLSDPQERASSPAVAVDLFGNATVAWDTVATNPTTYSVQARRIKGNGSLGPTADIYVTSDAQGVTGIYDSQVGVNLWGNAVVAWHLETMIPEPLYARQFRADGSLGATRYLGGGFTGAGGVVVNGWGKATIVWDDSMLGDGISDVKSRVMNPNGSLGPSTVVSPTGEPGHPFTSGESRVAIDGAGKVTAVWRWTDPDTGARKIQARSLDPASGTPGPLLDLRDVQEGRAVGLDVAAGAGGHAVAVWTFYTHMSTNPDGIIEGRRINPNGSLEPIGNISGPHEVSRDSRVAVDRFANATAVWNFGDGAHTRIQAAQEVMPPTCSNTAATVRKGFPKSIGLPCTGLAIAQWSIVTGPQHGTLTPNNQSSTSTFKYTPEPGYTGADSFTFKAANRGGESNTATVSISVGYMPYGR